MLANDEASNTNTTQRLPLGLLQLAVTKEWEYLAAKTLVVSHRKSDKITKPLQNSLLMLRL